MGWGWAAYGGVRGAVPQGVLIWGGVCQVGACGRADGQSVVVGFVGWPVLSGRHGGRALGYRVLFSHICEGWLPHDR
jgi:hypothetical protein